MACDFLTVFASVVDAFGGVNDFENKYKDFVSSLIGHYPEDKDAIIAAAKKYNNDYEYDGGSKQKSRRNTLRKSRRTRKQ